MTHSPHALYEIAAKALVFNGDKLLVLRTPDGYLDFPGGRVNEDERELSWHEALQREITEELGGDFRVDIGHRPAFVSKRQYDYQGTHHIAAIFFVCRFLGGDIQLSDEHGAYGWRTPAELFASPDKFISSDEKACLQAYFNQ